MSHTAWMAGLLALLAPAASAQEMAAPHYKPGDRWVWRETDLLTKNEVGKISETVSLVDGGQYWIESRRQAHTWWRGDAAKAQPLEQLAYDDGAPDKRGKTLGTNDGGCAYPWPLRVGQKFECQETVLFPNGWRIRYELKWSVEAAEAVATPAGRFDTLRLQATGYAVNLTQNTNTRHERVVWLAPAVKREVRHEIRGFTPRNQPFRVEGRELLEYQVDG